MTILQTKFYPNPVVIENIIASAHITYYAHITPSYPIYHLYGLYVCFAVWSIHYGNSVLRTAEIQAGYASTAESNDTPWKNDVGFPKCCDNMNIKSKDIPSPPDHRNMLKVSFCSLIYRLLPILPASNE